MANQVFANGREVACKAGAGKTIASFPDVCMTPPENPATPPGVPVPYPNTGFTSDTTSGTKSIKISKKEVGIKNKSYFKTSTGDEAGCAAKKGVKSSKNKGKVYFTSWSSDVKFEGKNVVRHLDTTTNNHGSPANEALPWPFIDSQAVGSSDPCAKDKKKKEDACKKEGVPPKDPCPKDRKYYRAKSNEGKVAAQSSVIRKSDCLKARRCELQPYKKTKKGKGGCCPGQTGHHLLPDAYLKGVKKYKKSEAPCACVEGASHSIGTHGMMHAAQKYSGFAMRKTAQKLKKPATLKKVTRSAVGVLISVFPESGCDKACIEAQLRKYHEKDAEISPDHEIDLSDKRKIVGPSEVNYEAGSKNNVKFIREIFAKAKKAMAKP